MEPSQLASGDLAYLGDAALELMVREHLIRQGHSGPGRLNALAREYVTAVRQSAALERILPLLDETEAGVYRRARNQHKTTPPPSASAAQYRRATGLEALFAYLYLEGRWDRMRTLFAAAYPASGENPPRDPDRSREISETAP